MNMKFKELLLKILKIESIVGKTDANERVLNISMEFLKEFHFKKFVHEKTLSLLFYNNFPKSKKFKIILNAHLDVVPGNKNQFVPKVVADKLYARGACDMKSGATVMMSVFKDIAKKVNYPLALQLVTDEEIGGFNGTKHQIDNGISADFIISGESTNFQVNNEAKGIIWIKVSCEGKTAHGARPWEGDNAIQKINRFVDRMNKLFPIANKPVWRTTQNLAKIETTNTTINKVPGDCSALFDIRYVSSDKNEVLNKIRKILLPNMNLEVLMDEPSQFTSSNNYFINKLSKSIQKNLAKKVELVSYHGASDVRHYDRVGISGVCFGPLGGGLHSEDEWISVKSLHLYYKMLSDFLLSLNTLK